MERPLDKLYEKVNRYIKEKDIKIDAVVPILRGSAFSGAYLAFKLNLLRILPVQLIYYDYGYFKTKNHKRERKTKTRNYKICSATC